MPIGIAIGEAFAGAATADPGLGDGVVTMVMKLPLQGFA